MPPSTINLEPQEILRLEFEYAQETAEQAQDDRTAVMNLYLLLVGGVGSILIGLSQAGGLVAPRGVYALVFFLLALTGFFVLLKLVRLRQAWYSSVYAMNKIKSFYLQRFPELEEAFLWKTGTIPARGKPWTITFNLAMLVAILDSVSLAVAVHFVGWRLAMDFLLETVTALLYFSWQMWFYFLQLPLREKSNGDHS